MEHNLSSERSRLSLTKSSFVSSLKKKYFWGIAGVLLLTFLVHFSYINNGFVWIDHQDIERGWGVITSDQWTDAFTSPLGRASFYRPVVVLSYSLDAALSKDWIPGYHLTNVLLQLLVVLVSIITAKRIFFFDNTKSLLVGIIAGIHPLTFLPVGVITYRQEIMVTLFSFLALVLYVEGKRKQEWKYGIFSLLSFIAALGSKETAFVWVPALIIAWELWLRKETLSPVTKPENYDYKLSLLYRGGIFLGGIFIMVFYILVRIKILPRLWNFPATSMTISEHIGTRINVIGIRLVELISPLKPRLSDATRIVSVADAVAILLLFFFMFLIFIVWKYHHQNPRAITILLFLGIGLAPALNVLPPPRFSAPHYGFFSISIIAMLAVLGYESLQRKTKQKWFWPSVLMVYLSIMAFSTFTAGFNFENDLTLFEPELARDPYFREAHFYVGTYYFGQQDFDEAVMHLEAAVKETPGIISFVDLPAAKINLAGAYLALGKLAEAEQLLNEVHPGQAELPLQIPYNLALIARERNNYGKIISLLENVSIENHNFDSLLLLAQAYLKVGEERKADTLLISYFPQLTPEQREELKKSLLKYSERTIFS